MSDNNAEVVDLSVLFNEETSDEAKEKIKTMFEAAVETRVNQIAEEMEAEIDALVEERLAESLASFEESVDKYTSYVAEEWLKENEIAIESALKVEVAESLIEGIKDLLASHQIDLPEDADGVVESLVARNEELASRLNESIEGNMLLAEKIELIECEKILEETCEGLPETHAAKLRGLAENVKFKDADDFKTKVTGMRETLFKEEKAETKSASPSSDSAPVLKEEKAAPTPTGDPVVDQIVEGVRKTFAPRA